MRVERKGGRRALTPKVIELHRQAVALQPAVDACERKRLKHSNTERAHYNCDKGAAECECTQQHNFNGQVRAGLGIPPWNKGGQWIRDLYAELDRLVGVNNG